MTTGSEQVIAVDTGAVSGASCELRNDRGAWRVSSTPGSITVKRSTNALTVTCSKTGHALATTTVSSSTADMLWANLAVGGIVGVVVDQGTGAAYSYPERVAVTMAVASGTPERTEQIAVTSASSPASTPSPPLVSTMPAADARRVEASAAPVAARTNSRRERREAANAGYCFSDRLNLLYRDADCGGRDRTVPLADVASLRAQSGATAFKIATVGTRIHTSTGGFYEILDVNGPMVSVSNAKGYLSNWLGLFYSTDFAIVDFDPRPMRELWPLAAGKVASFDAARDQVGWHIDIVVVREEVVTVPAGKFHAWVIERRTRGMGKNLHNSTRTFWYAPEVGFFVKHDFQLLAGTNSDGLGPWEALSIEPAKERRVARAQ